MAKIGRNERCPCGSGEKFKRCCGTREAQAALERQASALEELAGLPFLFPRLRPRGDAFAAWAERIAMAELGTPRFDEGLALVDAAERERIGREQAEEHPQVWQSLVADLADEDLARKIVVSGAVVAGVWERRPRDYSFALALLEDSPDEDAAEALALVLDAGDLWNVFESASADAALAELDDDLDDEAYELMWNATIVEQARRLGGTWHEARLTELVARVRSRLPLEGFATASAILARACDEFEREPRVRERLAALLLADSVGRLALAPPLAA